MPFFSTHVHIWDWIITKDICQFECRLCILLIQLNLHTNMSIIAKIITYSIQTPHTQIQLYYVPSTSIIIR